jgi:tyrosyl-tRNA synthetase
LDFDPSKPNCAEMVNNYDWFKEMSFLNFIRDVGKHITVNYMTSKDSVKKRLEGETGMSFTEFHLPIRYRVMIFTGYIKIKM